MNDTGIIVIGREVKDGLRLVPQHLREGLRDHVMIGRPVGGFLTAVLSNDLRTAACMADDVSLPALPNIMRFLHNFTPGSCWGSKERVDSWRKAGGASGDKAKADA